MLILRKDRYFFFPVLSELLRELTLDTILFPDLRLLPADCSFIINDSYKIIVLSVITGLAYAQAECPLLNVDRCTFLKVVVEKI